MQLSWDWKNILTQKQQLMREARLWWAETKKIELLRKAELNRALLNLGLVGFFQIPTWLQVKNTQTWNFRVLIFYKEKVLTQSLRLKASFLDAWNWLELNLSFWGLYSIS